MEGHSVSEYGKFQCENCGADCEPRLFINLCDKCYKELRDKNKYKNK